MIVRTGNRAFAGLGDLLSLPGTQALNAIDIAAAQPVVDLIDMVGYESIDVWTFLYQLNFDGGGAQTDQQDLTFYDSTGWSIICENENVNFAGTAFIERDRDAYVVGAGVKEAGSQQLSIATMARRRQTGGALLGASEMLLGWVDTTLGTGFFGQLNQSVPLPWVFRHQNHRENREHMRLDTEVAADVVVEYWFQVLSAPPGVLPLLP